MGEEGVVAHGDREECILHVLDKLNITLNLASIIKTIYHEDLRDIRLCG